MAERSSRDDSDRENPSLASSPDPDALFDRLVSWLDHEVKLRLLHIDHKLDEVVLAARGRGVPGSAGRNAVRSPRGVVTAHAALRIGRSSPRGPLRAVPDDSPPTSPPSSARFALRMPTGNGIAPPSLARIEDGHGSARSGTREAVHASGGRCALFRGAEGDRPTDALPGDCMSIASGVDGMSIASVASRAQVLQGECDPLSARSGCSATRAAPRGEPPALPVSQVPPTPEFGHTSTGASERHRVTWTPSVRSSGPAAIEAPEDPSASGSDAGDHVQGERQDVLGGSQELELEVSSPVPPLALGTALDHDRQESDFASKFAGRLNGLDIRCKEEPTRQESGDDSELIRGTSNFSNLGRTSQTSSATSSRMQRGSSQRGPRDQAHESIVTLGSLPALEAHFSGYLPAVPPPRPSTTRHTGSDASGAQRQWRSTASSGIPGGGRRSMASVALNAWEMLPSPARSELAHTVWKVLDDGESSLVAKGYERVIQCFIMFSVITGMLQSLKTQPLQGMPGVWVESSIDLIFTLEILLRFGVCPNRKTFFFHFYNYIDIASGIPLLLRMMIGFEPTRTGECIGSSQQQLSCVHSILIAAVPFLRLAKMLRRFLKIHLLLKAFHDAFEALPVMIYIYCLMLLGFSGVLFIVEQRDNLDTYYYSMWMTIVSMTTLGYGDVYPKTDQGRVVIGYLVFCTMFYTAIPLGIIGNAFNDVWKDRDRVLLMQRARNGMTQAGYSAKDVGKLFRIFDKDRDGMLNPKEFSWMIEGMRLGLTTERVYQLYDFFDGDGSGGIDEQEFVKGLFPERYHDLYGEMEDSHEPSRHLGSKASKGHRPA